MKKKPFQASKLPHDDPRYIKWRRSLLNRPAPWNKGQTKETNSSVAKISRTFRKKKIDNFSEWRRKKQKEGRWNTYKELKKDGDCAELIGAVLGDGSIYSFPRTEYLRIVCNTVYPGWIKRCALLVERVFGKKPHVAKRRASNCANITLYQKNIGERLGISPGSKGRRVFKTPGWILKNDDFIIRYLRGLYEAEGSLSVHKPTYTYKFIFANQNESLLDQVEYLWEHLGFHPHRSKYKVQISKKSEVFAASELMEFRKY